MNKKETEVNKKNKKATPTSVTTIAIPAAMTGKTTAAGSRVTTSFAAEKKSV